MSECISLTLNRNSSDSSDLPKGKQFPRMLFIMKKIKTTKCKVIFHNKQFIKDYTINLGTAQMSMFIDTRMQRNQFERTFSEEFKKWRSLTAKWLIMPNENMR